MHSKYLFVSVKEVLICMLCRPAKNIFRDIISALQIELTSTIDLSVTQHSQKKNTALQVNHYI